MSDQIEEVKIPSPTVTVEELEDALRDLATQEQQALANYHRVQGAQKVIQNLIHNARDKAQKEFLERMSKQAAAETVEDKTPEGS